MTTSPAALRGNGDDRAVEPDSAPGRPAHPRATARPAAPRLRALDGMRLVAALMVALYHLASRDDPVAQAWGSSTETQFPTAHAWLGPGSLGVDIFFIISGFVICMTGWGRPLRAFFASRVARLYPAYWAALALAACVFALPWVTYKTVSPSDGLVNLTMLQMPLGADRVLGVCWTLWAELRFYALFALCVILPAGRGDTRQRVILFSACWTLAAAVARGVDSEVLEQVVMPVYAPFFICGMGLYLVYLHHRDAIGWGIAATGLLLGQNAIVAKNLHAPHRPAWAIIAILTAGFLAVALVALNKLAWANWRWLTTAGALTYPFYLIHTHLGWVAIWGMHQKLGIPSLVTLLLTIALMLGLSWLLYRYVEKPLMPLIRRILLRPRPAASVPARSAGEPGPPAARGS